jgi:hypothetical protein
MSINRFEKDLTYDEAREVKESLESLFDSNGWKIVIEILENRCEDRRKAKNDFMPKSIEDMVNFASIHGGIVELELFPKVVHGIYEDAAKFVRDMQEEEDLNQTQENE